MNGRRAFLSGLVGLPLVGGGLAVIGRPTASAVPVSRDLMLAYDEFLFMERRILLHEMFPNPETRRFAEWHPQNSGRPVVGGLHMPRGRSWRDAPMPSSRAAVVLSAAGAAAPGALTCGA